ncbi:hypothetical protein D0869_00200 [Hortaea werneckii]|uniref:Mitochondrial division protein 1 n=1 Tax=Hortaea werneckii TaxID=91943 RepID=A0A3M6XHS4_HORWE|nr:hypothetical protein D0869_00200 [Hortaea werneckii]
MEDGAGWSQRRPSSNLMDYTSQNHNEHQDSVNLARMHSQIPAEKQARYYASRHGKASASQHRPRPMNAPPAPSITSIPTMPMPIPTNPNVIPGNTLPSAPASPPTPAPSPTPMQRGPDWSTADPDEDLGDIDLDETLTDRASTTSSTRGGPGSFGFRHMRAMFADMDNDERERMLAELLNMCDGKLLGFVAGVVGPRLKRDPFAVLPNELCLRILASIEDARTLARSSQVSRRWHELVSDDMAWKSLCEKHAYRRLSDDPHPPSAAQARPIPGATATAAQDRGSNNPYGYSAAYAQNPTVAGLSSSAPDLTRRSSMNAAQAVLPPTLSVARASSSAAKRRPKATSYRSHFKQRYQVETAWRTGGKVDTRQITPDQGVVTSLHLTPSYIIVALDNAKIHVFDPDGRHLRCLQGHVMGVWAMVPYGDVLVSGGCDRDVRVWDLTTGMAQHMLRGHTSTVRCLKMSGPNLAISGSRDTTLRVWDIRKGVCKHVLVGHQASVRCLEICGDLVVSGSYDTTARIWSISEGRCLRTLQGHFSQIYAVAFDGRRVATGSLDTSVRVWDPKDGRCLAQLQGHTSLVGQLQLRGDTLVTGGSDGSVRVWSLQTFSAIHRLAAHDNSVTSLQFDDGRIVSGGSDGRVKVWDLQRGCLVRELGSPAEAVWRVVFEEEKAVVLASRGGKTVMEVWSFAPPPEESPTADFFPSSSSTTTPLSSSSPRTRSPATISPYEDPASTAAADSSSTSHPQQQQQQQQQQQHRNKSRLHYEESLAQQQDEIMTEAYDTSHMLGSELEDGGGPILESDLRD